MRRYLALTVSLLLVACGKADNAPGPGGMTVGEAKALDEAAEMIEAQRVPPDAIAGTPVAPASAASPAPKAAAPKP